VKKNNIELKILKVCVKCHRRVPESRSAKVKQCPYCGGSLAEKVVVKKVKHHRMPNGKEVLT